jgi:hypothetical protein
MDPAHPTVQWRRHRAKAKTIDLLPYLQSGLAEYERNLLKNDQGPQELWSAPQVFHPNHFVAWRFDSGGNGPALKGAGRRAELFCLQAAINGCFLPCSQPDCYNHAAHC